jgi:parallel beta-helix repeat protein
MQCGDRPGGGRLIKNARLGMFQTFSATIRQLVAVLAAMSISRSIPAATITVDVNGGGAYVAIQPAIDAASAGDTIIVKPGEYVVETPVSFKGKKIMLQGEAGASQTTIRMSPNFANYNRAWAVIFESKETADSILDGFTLTGGKGGDPWVGGGICCTNASSPLIRNCIVTRNAGLGVWSYYQSAPALSDCTISENASTGIKSSGSMTVSGCTISRNVGFAVEADLGPTFSLSDCAISDNGYGPLFSGRDVSASLTGCTIAGNGSGVGYGSCARGVLTNCTIAGNGSGVGVSGMTEPRLCGGQVSATNCIIWDNGGPYAVEDARSSFDAAYSCLEGYEAAPGGTNIGLDPLFCGWGRSDIYVDPAHPGPGDGGPDDPYPDLRSALDGYSLSLSADSPCIGSGSGGVDMGAGHAISDCPVGREARIHLGAGTYEIPLVSLAHHVSIIGAGPDETVLQGKVRLLRSERTLKAVKVMAETPLSISYADSPQITDCAFIDTGAASAVVFMDATPILTRCSIHGQAEGIVCARRAVTMEDCSISGCTTGVKLSSSSALLSRCSVWKNGVGIKCSSSSLRLDHCSLVGNSDVGLEVESSAPVLDSCIVYDNGNAIREPSPSCIVTFSCIEGNAPRKGQGNIASDPRFCGWSAGDVFADPANAPPGDGSAGNPYADLRSAFPDRWDSLAQNSPCIGAGAHGTNMGAPVPISDCPAGEEMVVHLAEGIHEIYPALSLYHRVTIEGAGAGTTTILGGITGLKTGTLLRNVTVTGSTGIAIGGGQSPEILDCAIIGSQLAISCEGPATFNNCSIAGNQHAISGGASSTFTNCIFAGNNNLATGSSPKLVNCTIADNYYLNSSGSAPVLRNCIVWGSGADQVTGSLTACLVNKDPLFVKNPVFDFNRYITVNIDGTEVRLPDYIVSAPDYHLKKGSPAIDAGIATGAPDTDLEGIARPQGRTVDIGAYEFWDCNGNRVPDNDDIATGTSADANANAIPDECEGGLVVPGDANGDGGLDISDAVAVLGVLFLGSAKGFPCGDGSMTDQGNLKLIDWQPDGAIDISDGVAMLSFLFLGGKPHTLAPEADLNHCVRIAGCSDLCGG